MEPVTEAIWIALEEETMDALLGRRRMREKVSPVFKKMMSEEGEEAKERRAEDPVLIQRIIEEEMVNLIHDDPESTRGELKLLGGLKKMIEEKKESEEILQTKIVSPYEVQRNWEEWKDAAAEEIRSLLEEKEALEKMTKTELEEMKRQVQRDGKKIEVIPSKVVFTKKPGPKGGKPKVRWVVCGNFETKRGEEDTFSSGADSTAMRMMIHTAVQRQWKGGTLDVKTAFLNADWKDEDEVVLVVKPPLIFTELGALERDTFYRPKKAVYGFRRSPRLWGDYRDSVMEEMKVELEDGRFLELKALESEPNLWKIQRGEEGLQEEPELLGLIMTYVDDMFFVGEEKIVKLMIQEMRRCWKTSEPEMVGKKSIRFLGMDVHVEKNEETGFEEWFVSQESYIRDLIAKEEVAEKRIPISREQSAELSCPEPEPQLEDVRGAQKVVGELLWLLTRSRPDLMFAMSKLCASVLRSPKKVIEISSQVKGYLKATLEEGLKFTKEDAEEARALKVFTDASFAPDGGESHGCVLVMLGTSLISWKSGRQSTISLSTAAAELSEVVEGMALGEATAVLAEEVCGEVVRLSFTDSQAALAIMSNEGGSWRTRHLRMRAMFARSLIENATWMIYHLKGEQMLADIGTKPLASPRLKTLKKGIGMTRIGGEKDAGEGREESRRTAVASEANGVEKALMMLVMAVQIAGAKGQEEDEEDLGWFVTLMSLVMIFAAIGFVNTLWWCLARCRGRRGEPREEPLMARSPEDEAEMEGEEGLRRRVLGSRSPYAEDRGEREILREEARRMMRRERSEPGEEPGTLYEDIAGATAIMEEVQHPDDWDPETHGDIPCGKGEPPAAYFERRAEKGAKGTGRGRIPHSKSEEKGKSRFGGAAGSGSQGAAGSGSQRAAGSGSQGAVGKGQGGAVGSGSQGGVAGSSQQAEEEGPPQVRSCGGGHSRERSTTPMKDVQR